MTDDGTARAGEERTRDEVIAAALNLHHAQLRMAEALEAYADAYIERHLPPGLIDAAKESLR